MIKRIKNFVTVFCITLLTLGLCLLALEVIYRYQWIDFYRSELNSLNRKAELTSPKKKILVCGDSFSAQPHSYVQLLKDSLHDYTVINSAVSGTSMREMSLLAQKRIDEFRPDKLILQLYAGNDLTDISHPYNLRDISLLRNLYWKTSDHLYSLAWINYRLGGIRTPLDNEQRFSIPNDSDTFSVTGYNGRVKLLIKADPEFIQQSINLQNENYRKAFCRTAKYLDEISAYFLKQNPHGEILLLTVPVCIEVNERYKRNYEKLGAAFHPATDKHSETFYTRLQDLFPKFTFVNPSDSLINYELNGNAVYFTNDDHLNANGQMVTGKAVLKTIK